MTFRQSSDVLILMASLNGAVWLPAQLDSIASQTMQDWALYVSDDGSTDATRAILADFAARHPDHNIRICEGPRKGNAAANFLALIARDDLPLGPRTHVALADQDDIWMPHKLSRALSVLDKARRAGRPLIYGAQSLHIDERGRSTGRSRYPHGRVTLHNALVQNMVSGHSLVLDPAGFAIARAAGAPSGIAFHDWWLGQLILACGGEVIIDAETVLFYRQHRHNAIGAPIGPSAALRRLHLLSNRSYAGWIKANLTALSRLDEGADIRLVPEAAALVRAMQEAPSAGPSRVAALARMGIRRQDKGSTALLWGAALLGWA